MSQNQRKRDEKVVEVVTLTIQKHPNGEVHVNGPIGNLYMCYALLELAKDALRTHNAQGQQQKSSQIIVPQMRLS